MPFRTTFLKTFYFITYQDIQNNEILINKTLIIDKKKTLSPWVSGNAKICACRELSEYEHVIQKISNEHYQKGCLFI